MSRARTRRAASALLLALGLGAGCDRDGASGDQQEGSPPADAGPAGLTPELRAKVIARVGNKAITLGEYAAVLEQMDPFERLRYQSPDRRKQLLQEIIDVELLAAEAERRGLAKDPEVQERMRIVLRDELLQQVRSELPSVEQIPEAEVRAYYDKHRAEFREPERRRLSHIVMAQREAAQAVLEQARSATAEQWGKLVRQHSLDKPAPGSDAASAPLELAGDLGIVHVGDDQSGGNADVPVPLRAAVFELDKLGDVYPKLVEVDGKFHIVRLTGRSEARDRSMGEAQRAIRVAIVRQRFREAEARLERELREKYPVKVDQAALSQIKVELEDKGSRGSAK